jgi:hypothetical protein
LEAAKGHPYLSLKNIPATENIFAKGENLIIPMRDVDGEIRSYQQISPAGDKRYLYGAQKSGLMHQLGPEPSGVIYLVEGFATGVSVCQATGKSVFVAFDTSGLLPAAKALRAKYPGTRIIVAGDNDRLTPGNPGKTSADKVAAAVPNVSVILPIFQTNDGTDFNDLANAEGIEAVKGQIVPISNIEERPRSVDFNQLASTPPLWIIKNVIPQDALIMLFGPSGGGKSFVALDMAHCIALGMDWHGNKIAQQGAVYYICGEGDNGIGRRAEAWQRYHRRSLPDGSMYKTTSAVPLTDPEELARVIADIKAIGNVRLVEIDTLNRNFGGGNENSTEDMTDFIKACDAIRLECGCSVMIYHHTGLTADGRGRGSSVLRAAMDTEIMLAPIKDTKDFNLIGSKMKDGEDVGAVRFTLMPVELGEDEDGEPFGSCVVVYSDEQGGGDDGPDPRMKKMGKAQRLVYESALKLLAMQTANLDKIAADTSDVTFTEGQLFTFMLSVGDKVDKDKYSRDLAKVVGRELLVKNGVQYGSPV